MKKYLLITKTAFKEQLQYLGNVFGGFLVYALIVFVFLSLWKYIFSDGELIHGYTINQLIWYIIVTEFILFAGRSNVIQREIMDDIKTGKVAYILNKPYNYILYIISKHFGTIIPNVIGFLFFGSILGFIYIGELKTFTYISIPFIVVTLVLGLLIVALFYIIIGLASFWLEEVSPFKWIFSKILVVLGVTFPIEFFPSSVVMYVKYSPVYVITYAPAKMLVDYSFDLFKELILYQGIYIVILGLIITLMYKKGVKRLNVNGG